MRYLHTVPTVPHRADPCRTVPTVPPMPTVHTVPPMLTVRTVRPSITYDLISGPIASYFPASGTTTVVARTLLAGCVHRAASGTTSTSDFR